ncbi:MAG: hypothetical protein K6A62_02640 [Bacteroidales bacterium]|nr:hypothetical protein [Bacteroidales bacterium]
MKRILPIMMLLLACFAALAGEPYSCTTPGRTLTYERTKANGRLERTTTMEYTAVRRVGNVRYVDCILTVLGPGGGEQFGGPSKQTTLITADGTVKQDLAESMKAVIHNVFQGASQSAEGTPAILPADMKPGDKLPDGHAVVKTGIMTHTMDIIEREVLRYERITVPAGTFDCVVLREHKIEHGIGRNRDTVCENWYAPGIGPVRHDSYYYNNGNPSFCAREVLKKY